mgnify:FL=1
MFSCEVDIVLKKIYGEGSVRKATPQEIQQSKEHNTPEHIKNPKQYEVDESLVDAEVQCSRCLHIQTADISESSAIKCENCDEIDYCYSGDEIIQV